ncbi:DUF4254 domain-containing protein [Nocardia camponoti]|uniref:Uncharacterized protein n=1 Tax=Nocardia camponoti TaxID=1616106 RepID=A0A917QV04_9NOCA|nr:DUF4254 domain-containing protein [Nocardia camponoti]GGK69127.1 hypothetical protein GCM10011591_46600 [Nocardia camponoti]
MSALDTGEIATVIVCELPTGRELVAAFRGGFGHLPGDHLIGRWGQALAQLHRTRHINPDKATRVDQRRAEMVEMVDTWVANYTNLAGAGYGAAADLMAATYVGFEALFHSSTPVDFEDLHRAWTAVADHVVAWDDLRTGHAPVPWPLDLSPQSLTNER